MWLLELLNFPVKAPAAKKKQRPPGVTAGKGGSRASHEEPERGTNGGDGEPPQGASSKAAAPFQAEGKEAKLWGCCGAGYIGSPCRNLCEAYGTGGRMQVN
ncbi:hypothetical protein IQ13_1040 [Lacibacter cauensis]|uniref:Uncharacterized protein n=1 Tax=Lacibacter cauensis TaxID=510947 RepID=A0A562SX97_9BACT|nr:hypothetical protein IQ13_1040 [Lacibacter cauensis]